LEVEIVRGALVAATVTDERKKREKTALVANAFNDPPKIHLERNQGCQPKTLQPDKR
jgi:hypothetical protein